jgi:ABC-type enterochelin transport system permease subunit
MLETIDNCGVIDYQSSENVYNQLFQFNDVITQALLNFEVRSILPFIIVAFIFSTFFRNISSLIQYNIP